MTQDIFPKNVCSFIALNGTGNLSWRKSVCFKLELVSVVVLVESQSRRSCFALRVSSSLCVVLSFFLHVTCTDDPHRLKCAIKSQVRSQLIPVSIHAIASLNKLLTHQCLRNLEHIVIGSHRKMNCAWWRDRLLHNDERTRPPGLRLKLERCTPCCRH